MVSVLLYFQFENWTLKHIIVAKDPSFHTAATKKFLNIPVKEHINIPVGYQEPLLSLVKHLKLTWFGHVTQHDFLGGQNLLSSLSLKEIMSKQKNLLFRQ